MKKLVTFTIYKEETVDKTELTKNEAGEEISITKKVKEKVPKTFFLRRPNRALSDTADLFYGEKYAEAFNRGMLSRAVIEKKLNDQGIFTEKEKKKSETLSTELFKLQEEYQKANLKPESERTDEDKEHLEKLKSDFAIKSQEYSRLESVRNSLFTNTIETWARNQLAIWWTLNLSYYLENDKEKPLFPGETYDDKLKKYDAISEEGNLFEIEAAQKSMLYTAFWLYNKDRDISEEEFQDLDKRLADAEQTEQNQN